MSSAAEGRIRLPAALTSGAIAIVVNTLALAADHFGLATARGGLLRLVTLAAAAALPQTASGAALAARLRAAAAFAGVQTAFHLGVGLLMAVA
jgi:hypothetical protein